MCEFNMAWIGKCPKEGNCGDGLCEEHSKLKCVICGKQAYMDCGIAGSLVCGAPICSEICNRQHQRNHGW